LPACDPRGEIFYAPPLGHEKIGLSCNRKGKRALSPLVGEGWGEGLSLDSLYPSPGSHLSMRSDLSHKGRGEQSLPKPTIQTNLISLLAQDHAPDRTAPLACVVTSCNAAPQPSKARHTAGTSMAAARLPPVWAASGIRFCAAKPPKLPSIEIAPMPAAARSP